MEKEDNEFQERFDISWDLKALDVDYKFKLSEIARLVKMDKLGEINPADYIEIKKELDKELVYINAQIVRLLRLEKWYELKRKIGKFYSWKK